ncbi:fibronectin type III domain-containing protein 7-like [Leptodactylus fuscus]|uniref:fibronectin type III domain-containing protein 7-like n=1 Tax=Leptodactylus fuscus TaxID=238119 RepID=UPI003F4EB2E3
MDFHTAPCVPRNLVKSVTCETYSVSLSWDETPGAATYTLTALVGQNETSITTTNTFYVFDSLLCDTEYDIILSSKSASCVSNGNNSIHIKTIPCPPQILEAYASCDNNSGLIQWEISRNARSYMAAVEGVNTFTCNTTNTICATPELECGQNYTVTVWAEDGTCTGQNSTNITFKTVPCVPQNINTTMMCQEDALNVFWDISQGATGYSATAVGRQGDLITAEISNNKCLLSPLQCGDVYSLNVLALHDECKSVPSATTQVKSAPCSLTYLTATPDCGTVGSSVHWDPSEGAVSYTAVFHGPDGSEVSCDTSTTSCSVSELQCGQLYNVTATAFDGICHSIATNATVTTAPCMPTNIETSIDCLSSDLINVTWSPSRGAVSYVVVAKGNNGHTLSCNTTTNMCAIQGVRCGYTYSVLVTAWNAYCSTEADTEATVETVPCTPDVVEVDIDCMRSEVLVSWNDTNLYPAFYKAVAIDPSGNEHFCADFSTSCQISGLECGLEYGFLVYSSNRQCQSLNSPVLKSMTAPCQPRDIITDVQCENNNALISWTESRGANYYLTTLSGNGTIFNCNTTATNCSYLSLQCGQTYNVSVMAVDDKCHSLLSSVSTFETAPCQPQGLTVDLDCSSQIASMFWKESDGAQIYNVVIESNNGAVSSYTTNNTFFSSNGLACGQTYGFSVVAMGRTCNSSKSLTVYENSAPCIPLSLTYTKNCPTSMASISWSASEGALTYYVTATDPAGLEMYCNSTNTNCSLMGLSCGLSYNVNVKAVGPRCSSNTSSSMVLSTAPCLPNNPSVSVNCENNSATLSWEGSKGALGYLAMVKHEDWVYSCDTEATSCFVPDLICGLSYSFSVMATDGECKSPYTAPIGFGAVPCAPRQVETSIYRGSLKPQEVEVSWNGSHCGSDYMATIQGQIGLNPESAFVLNSYWTSYMDFYIPVPCSSIYNVTVTARNTAGPSYPSTPIMGYTAPCSPQVKPLQVTDGKILISWEETPYANEYRVVTMDNTNIVCTTPGLSCLVQFTTSAFQVIAVNSGGESTPAYLSGYNGVSK